MKRFCFYAIVLLTLTTLHICGGITVTTFINSSSTTFIEQSTGTKIPAKLNVDISANPISIEGLTNKKLELVQEGNPDLPSTFKISVEEENDDSVTQVNVALTKCIIRETPKITAITITPCLERRTCRTGNNVIEIKDREPVVASNPCKFEVTIFPEELLQRRITSNAPLEGEVTESPFTPNGFCYNPRTVVLFPEFTEFGTICSESFVSTSFKPGENVTRDYLIYLPHGYFENTQRRYPVVYYLHGNPSTPKIDSDDYVILLDLFIADGRIPPMIVVFPNGNAPVTEFLGKPLDELPDEQRFLIVNGNSIPSYWANSSVLGNMEDTIVFDLVDHIDATYRTKADKQYRGINGFSGGGQAHRLAFKHSDRFGSVSTNSGFGIDWEAELVLYENIDTIYSALAQDAGFTNSHLATIIPTNIENPASHYLPCIYNIAMALSPNPNAPYLADFPLDEDGKIIKSIKDRWEEQSAEGLVKTRADEIKKNNLKIFFDGGSLDFFYFVNSTDDNDNPGIILIDAATFDTSYYNLTSKSLSLRLIENGIDHTFVSYRGDHNTQSGLQTLSSLLFHAACFAGNNTEQGLITDAVKFMGTGTIILEESSQMIVPNGASVSIQTDPTIVQTTCITVTLKDEAKFHVGNENTDGGCFQIGNIVDKFNFDQVTTMSTHSIKFNLTLDGPKVEFQLNRQGFVGLGVGVTNKQTAVPNEYIIRTLNNVDDITIDVREGTFRHNQIFPGTDINILDPGSPIEQSRASLLAIGPAKNYGFTFHPIRAVIKGGGNIVSVKDAKGLLPQLGNGTFILNPGENILFHKEDDGSLTFQNDHRFNPYAGPVSQGIRDLAQEKLMTEEISGIFNERITIEANPLKGVNIIPGGGEENNFIKLITYDSHAYKNQLVANIFASKPILKDPSKPAPPSNATQDQLCNYLKINAYEDQSIKRGAIAQNHNDATLVYLESQLDSPFCEKITRIDEEKFPNPDDIDASLKTGAAGIILSAQQPRKLVQIYDLQEL